MTKNDHVSACHAASILFSNNDAGSVADKKSIRKEECWIFSNETFACLMIQLDFKSMTSDESIFTMKYETGKYFSRSASDFTLQKRAEWSLTEKVTSFYRIERTSVVWLARSEVGPIRDDHRDKRDHSGWERDVGGGGRENSVLALSEVERSSTRILRTGKDGEDV